MTIWPKMTLLFLHPDPQSWVGQVQTVRRIISETINSLLGWSTLFVDVLKPISFNITIFNIDISIFVILVDFMELFA